MTILPRELSGVCKITGYRGKGKSYFAAQMEDPASTAFFDFERKGAGINAQIGFGYYAPVTEHAAGGGLGVWDAFERDVDKMPAGMTHAILDNTAPLEMAIKAEVNRNADSYARQFGMNANNIRENRYGGASGVVNYLVSEKVCNVLWSRGVQLITVTSHVKPKWAGGVQVPNAYNIKGADRWDELSVLTLVMIPGDTPPVPSALVMKEQLGSLAFNGTEFAVRRRLPYRLPVATPAAVYRYLTTPADLEHPAPGEMPRHDEIAPFLEELSREQIAIILAEVEREKVHETIPTPPPIVALHPRASEVQALITAGKTPRDVADALGMTVAEVVACL